MVMSEFIIAILMNCKP